jgi:hypothetical protein
LRDFDAGTEFVKEVSFGVGREFVRQFVDELFSKAKKELVPTAIWLGLGEF